MTRDITHEKYVQAINFFARKSAENTVNRLKLMKLLWLADRLHLQKYGRMILNVTYVAMKNGPVPSEVMDVTHNTNEPYTTDYLHAVGHNISSKANFNDSLFNKTELDVYQDVWVRFHDYGPFDLKDLSHEYPEWKRFEDILEKRNTSIPMTINDFFENPNTELSEADFFDIDEAKREYMKKKYENGKALIDAMHEAHSSGRIRGSRIAVTPCH